MVIYWGRKRVEKSLGRVADFCPICRDLRAFEIFRVGIAGHVYGLTLGEGKLAGYVKQCRDCSLRLGAEPQQYAAFDEGATTDVEVLIAKTFPSARQRFADRLAFEEQLRRNPQSIPPETRQAQLLEPFVLLNPAVEEWFGGNVPLDAPSGLGCLGTIVLTGALFFYGAMAKHGPAQGPFLLATLAIGVIGTVFTLLQLYLRPRRRVRDKILPFLARSLKPLDPMQSEVQTCLDRCAQMGMKIGKVVKAEQVRAGLQNTRAFPLSGRGQERNLVPMVAGIAACVLLVVGFCFYLASSSRTKNVPTGTGLPSVPPQPEKVPPPANAAPPAPQRVPPPVNAVAPSPAKMPQPVAVNTPPPAPQPANAVGTFIAAPGRTDMVHDPKRGLLYISAGDSVLRYQMASRSFLPPLALGGNLRGIDLSPDGDRLAVADASTQNGSVGIHLVNLETGVDSPVTFPAERLESGTFSVAFGADGAVWITSTIAGSGGQWPLRKHVPASKQTTVVSRVGQDTMLAASADRAFIAYADSGSSPGSYGRFPCGASALPPPLRASSYLYEIGISRDGRQLALPTYGNLVFSGASVTNLNEPGTLAAAYHPRGDFVFLARAGTSVIEVLETANYTPVKRLDFGTKFDWIGNHAFQAGRLRLSSDGQFIFCTVLGGVRYAETGL